MAVQFPMIESDAVESLISTLNGSPNSQTLDALFSTGDLSRVFPALGIPQSLGMMCLQAVVDRQIPESLGEPGRQICDYLSAYRQIGVDFERFVRSFREHESEIVESAWDRAAELLPASAGPASVKLVLLPLGMDFRTERETVYIDPLAALALGLDGVESTLSHELHHVGRYLATGQNLTLMAPEPLDVGHGVPGIFRNWSVWLEAEGIADCVSNVTQTDVPPLHAAVSRRRREMDEHPLLLRQSLDQLSKAQARAPVTPEDLLELRNRLRNLAHPVGARMAEAIQSKLGRSALVDCVGRPAEFVLKYNQVARSTAGAEVGSRFTAWLNRD